jgi:hypothetical protein
MDIEASCVLLQKLGKKLESRKDNKLKEKSSNFNAQMERLIAIEKILKQSRLKYIIINLFEMQRNGWPKSKSKKEEPKKIKTIRQDIEKEKEKEREKLFEKNTRRSYYCDEYKDEYTKNQKSTLTERKNKPLKDDEVEQGDTITRITEHLSNYMEGKAQPYDLYKKANKYLVKSTEFMERIFHILTHDVSLFGKIIKDKGTFIEYLINFEKENIFKYSELIQGVNKYVQLNYENEIGENPKLDDLIVDLYIKGHEKSYYNIKDIHFFDALNEDMYLMRIKLAEKLLLAFSGIEVAKLKKFYAEKINPMVEATDPEYFDEEVIENMKKLLGDDSKKGVDVGYEIMSGVLGDNKLSVSIIILTE